jgi:hypothetical protein
VAASVARSRGFSRSITWRPEFELLLNFEHAAPRAARIDTAPSLNGDTLRP